MEDLLTMINKVEDNNTREALLLIAKYIAKDRAIPPVKQDLQQVTLAVNKILGHL